MCKGFGPLAKEAKEKLKEMGVEPPKVEVPVL